MLTCPRLRYTPLSLHKSEVAMARPATKDLKIVISPSHEIVTVSMIGETHFDFDTADKHIREVLKHKPKTVLVDASALSFISSIGMCFLINLRRAAKEAGVCSSSSACSRWCTRLTRARPCGAYVRN